MHQPIDQRFTPELAPRQQQRDQHADGRAGNDCPESDLQAEADSDKFFRTDRIAFGSRVLFEPELGIGTRINNRLSVEASWVHMSHAQLFGGENPGIDNLGVRLNLAL